MSKKVNNVNHGITYDSYYGSENSVYKQLYKDEVIEFDKDLVHTQARQLIKYKLLNTPHDREITIVDYGCGDGRFLRVYEDLARGIKKEFDFSLKIIGYDPSLQGLKDFAKKLSKSEFIAGDSNAFHSLNDKVKELDNHEFSYKAASYKKGNLSLELIHGHVEDKVEHITSLIGKCDLTLLMFCVLSHVIGKEKRVELLKGLDEISTKIFFSVPGPAILSEYQYAFDVLRTKKVESDIFNIASSDGDIIYTRSEDGGESVQNYLHIYKSSKDLKDELELANIRHKSEIGINKILHETHLINHPWLSKLDKYATKITNYLLPHSLLDVSLQISRKVNDGYEYITGDHHLVGSYYGVLVSDNMDENI